MRHLNIHDEVVFESNNFWTLTLIFNFFILLARRGFISAIGASCDTLLIKKKKRVDLKKQKS